MFNRNHRQSVNTLYSAIRTCCFIMGGILVMIVGIILWRRLSVEGLSFSQLQYGEQVSMGILSLLAVLVIGLGLWINSERRRIN